MPLKKSLQRGRGRGWKSFFYPLTPECQVHKIGKEPFLSWPSPPRQFHRFPVFGCCPSKAIFHPPLAPRLPPSLHLPQRESGAGATQAVFLPPQGRRRLFGASSRSHLLSPFKVEGRIFYGISLLSLLRFLILRSPPLSGICRPLLRPPISPLKPLFFSRSLAEAGSSNTKASRWYKEGGGPLFVRQKRVLFSCHIKRGNDDRNSSIHLTPFSSNQPGGASR